MNLINMSTYARQALALFVTTILAGIIVYLTLTPTPLRETTEDLLLDKAYHAIAFAALVFPAAFLYRSCLIWLIPAALVFGAAIELIQPYVGRSAQLADFVADVIGVTLGLLIGHSVRLWFSRLRKSKTKTA